jgi:2-polyprenyl-6-methoxyphenol hydroxylase-like FAD-dependent oxidoreductase
MEPILAERARELGAELRFGTELVSFAQHEEGVTAVLRDLDTGASRTVEVDYLVAADGHRSPIRRSLGIEMIGRGVLGEGTGTLFDADLSDHGDFLAYLLNPDLPGGAGVLVGTDVPGRYAIGVSAVDGPPDWVRIIRTATGVPDLEPKIHALPDTTSQTVHGVAERFQDGRVLLVGDAARLMPPTGAFGGNTAIMDGFSLAWKLAMVTRGEAGPGLLASHDPERRPYSTILADQQLLLFTQRGRPSAPVDDLPAPVSPVSSLFFGYRQLGGAIVAEPGDPGDLLEDPAAPTGRPGVRAPYVKLATGSTTALLGRGFVLLAGDAAWRDTDLPIEVHVLDEPEFFAAYGISPAGAVLVRPDFVIAWRSNDFAPAELTRAWRTVLDL